MSDYSLMNSKEHSKKFAHFSSLVFIAQVDGNIDESEMLLLTGFAKKLGITDEEYKMILENPTKYPVPKSSDPSRRMRRLFEMFQIIFADHHIDDKEKEMIYQYAIELGFSSNYATKIIDKSIKLFTGKFNFEVYSTVMSERL